MRVRIRTSRVSASAVCSIRVLTLIACLAAAPVQAFVQPDECAIIVASRQSLAEVDAFIASNPQINYGPVYLSSNGWYAISAGTVKKQAADGFLASLKRRSVIPPDSYCSNADQYVSIARDVATRSTAQNTRSQFSSDPFAEFDARPLTVEEKRYLQAALALKGYYNGLLDGAWGRGSQGALDQWAWDEFQIKPTNGIAAALTMEGFSELDENAWTPKYFPALNLSVQMPSRTMSLEKFDPPFEQHEDWNTGVSLTVSALPAPETAALHRDIAGDHTGYDEPYLLRDRFIWVTSIKTGRDRVYLRSHLDRVRQQWVSTMVAWPDTPSAMGQATLMIGSISSGRGQSLRFPEYGHLAAVVEEFIDVIDEERSEASRNTAREPASTPSTPTEPEHASSSGTGFYVTAGGLVLTNAHVVEGCTSISVNGSDATILAENEGFDLAILQGAEAPTPVPYLPFASSPARLNADITIAGYPLHGLLGGLNITRGAISSLQGLRGDAVTMQISAPVQQGNSGGPVVNSYGEVVGIVVAKLDTLMVADAIGDVPQNVNFAIRAPIAEALLSANGVSIERSSEPSPLPPEEIAQRLQAATVLVECR